MQKSHRIFIFICFALLVMIISCKNEDKSASSHQAAVNHTTELKQKQIEDLFHFVDASASGLNFENSLHDTLEFNIFYYEYNYNGGGVAIGDVNNDGLPDIYFSGTFVPNRLYINMGNLKFKDVTEQTGVTGGPGIKTGVSFVDINNDGLLDIYVCKSGKVLEDKYRQNQLYINKGNLKFEEEGHKYGIDDASYSTQAYFSDLDLDGDLDMYLVNHPIGWGKQDKLELAQDTKGNISVIKDTARYHISDRLYINENGKYLDKTKQFHVDNIAFGLSAVISDFNDDGYPDIYVCNDYTAPDNLYINQKGKDFKDEVLTYFSNITSSSMGSDISDFNNDGKMDLYVNDMMPEDETRLKENKNFIKNYDSHLLGKKFKYHDQFRYNAMQVKTGDKFENMSFYTGTSSTDWSWSVLGEDYDENGFDDLFITNGYLKDVVNMDYSKYVLDSLKKNVKPKDFYGEWIKKVPSAKLTNYFYANNGDMQFDNVSKIWCDGRTSFSNGAAYGDLDNDGDLDLVVNNINDAAFLMENTLNTKKKNHYVNITLKGDKSNMHGYGASLTAVLEDDSRTTKIFNPFRGYMSSMDQRCHFGSSKTIKNIEVKWPGGLHETFAISQDGELTLQKGKGSNISKEVESMKTTVNASSFPWKHNENEYIDFKREPLLHLKNSTEGPTLSIGDVNGDHMDDVFVGGAGGQGSVIFLQLEKGWQEKVNPDFSKDASFEDVASSLNDFDGDGDLDLIVASGGYQFDALSPQYQLRYYTNDGKGQFTRNTSVLPDIRTNANSLCAADFDGDGDIDVFIGAGPLPNNYPVGDKSFYLENNGGKFSDATNDKLPHQGKLSIIKDCVAGDMNKDGKIDLVIAGDWSPITILLNKNGKFQEEDTNSNGLAYSNGLWQDLLLDDIDGDGDLDIIAGNLGTNSFFKASEEKPTCIYSGDFDGNGENDPIMCTYFGDKSYPAHPLDKMLNQMTSLRKKFLRYSLYAGKTMEEIFPKEKLDKAQIFRAYTFESAIFINEKGKYTRKALSQDAQLSMVKDMAIVKNNGVKSLAIVGNFWDTDFDYGKYDASHGVLFTIDSKGNLIKSSGPKGLEANGNIRELKKLSIKGKEALLLGGNNEQVKLLTF